MADKYCTRCGYSNAPTRGACLMCLDYLDIEGRGVICPNPECGLENGKEATFCKYCGTPLAEEAAAIPGIVEAALSISNAMTGGTSDEFAEQEEMSEEDAAAFAEFQREQAETRGETVDEAPVAEDAAFEDEEEEIERPSALDLEQQVEEELTPPPPAEEEALSFDEEEGEAEEALSFDEEPVTAEPRPAPAPVEAAEELAFDEEEAPVPAVEAEVAPLPASEPVAAGPQPAAASQPAGELSEDDLIPPVPDDLPGFDDEVVTASVAAAPAAAPEAAEPETAEDEIAELSEPELSLDDEAVTPQAPAEEAAEAPAEGDEKASEEGDLGDWALDFEDES